MRHEVPQFIDIEDKVFGPLTFLQGLYLIGGFFGAFSVYYITGMLWNSAPFFLKASFGIPILALGIALAFVEINKRKFIKYIEAWFYFLISPKKYIWQKQENKEKREVNLDDDFILPGESNNTSYTIQNNDYKTKNKRSRLKSLAHDLDMDIE